MLKATMNNLLVFPLQFCLTPSTLPLAPDDVDFLLRKFDRRLPKTGVAILQEDDMMVYSALPKHLKSMEEGSYILLI